MSKGEAMVQESVFEKKLQFAYSESQETPYLLMIDYDEFLQYQKKIIELLGDTGFIMYTDKRAVLCLKKAPNLHIYLMYKGYFTRKDFSELCFRNLTIIGEGKKELPGSIKQYIIDLKDNIFKILFVTILFFSIFNLEKINIDGIISLSGNLINAISIFTGIVFVFIGFIYSDKEKAIDIFLKGCGDKYYRIDKYVMSLSIISLFVLILVSAFGGITREMLPQIILNLQDKNHLLDKLISYQMQYYLCLALTWFSLCSMIICFSALTDYYLSDLRNSFFIDAVKKKSKEL